ncbi:MAG: protein kinase domain-containing protein, partial [Planctomycetia bacterium]
RSVAIKVLDHPQRRRPAAVAWFFREARIASRLEHPGIVAIHEFDLSAAGQAFIVMERLSGITLKQRLAARTDLDADLPCLLAVFLQICQAVAYAHEHGVIHRDLKPSNIMVGRHGVVTVMDWGLAKVLALPDEPLPEVDAVRPFPAGSGETRSHLTASGTVFGTPAYLAPEQARGEIARVDTRADVFGLGGSLCEILSGSPPFVGPNPTATWAMAVDADVAGAVERLDACGGPAAVVRLAKRCLAASPGARPATAMELVTELTAYLESGQRRAEQELVRFFDLSADLFCIADRDGVLRRFNENLPRRLGFSAAELKGRPLVDLVHPDDRGETKRAFDRLWRGQPTLEFANRCRHADGRYLWLEWSARAVPEESAVYAVARDVSERSALAAFTAAAGLYLVSPRGLRERLGDVAEEAITHLDVSAMQVWSWVGKQETV